MFPYRELQAFLGPAIDLIPCAAGKPMPDVRVSLPEIDLQGLPAEQRPLADQVNRLRDRLDEVLFGFQDFGMVGKRPKA